MDYGCGVGVVAKALMQRNESAQCTLLDIDAYALAVAALNCPTACLKRSRSFDALRGARFDWIVSNPPFHIGNDMSYEPVRDFLSRLREHLNTDGEAWFVVPDTLPVARWTPNMLPQRVCVAGGHAVWCATRA